MKKSLIAATLASTVASSFAFNIGAVYVGVDVGGAWRSQDMKADEATQTAIKGIGSVTGSLKPTVGLHVGYDIAMGNGFMGAIDLSVNTMLGKDSVTRYEGTLTEDVEDVIEFNTRVQRTFGVALTPRVGYAVNPSLAVYAKFGIGMAWEKWNQGSAKTGNSDITWKADVKKTFWTFTPGVGVRYKFTKNMAVRLEYGYEFTTSKDMEILDIENVSVKSKSHQVNLGLSYHF